MKKYEIVNILWSFKFLNDKIYEAKLKGYKVETTKEVDYQIEFYTVESFGPCQGKSIIEDEMEMYIDGNIKRFNINDSDNNVVIRGEYENNISRFYMLKNSLDLQFHEYMLSTMRFGEIMRKEGNIVLHASAIKFDEDAILFSAPSGTGKSTQASLWIKQFVNCQYINDDRPVLTFKDGKIEVWGNPWSGKLDLQNNIHAPLRAVIFVEQAPDNNIVELTMVEKVSNCMNNLSIANDESTNDYIMDRCAEIVTKIDIFKLQCTVSSQAVSLTYGRLYLR